MTIAREIISAVVAELRADPSLARELRELLGVAATSKGEAPEMLYMRVPEYATRIAVSERAAWSMVARGMPTIGSGRMRRVDVRRADAWLRDRHEAIDDAVEKSARASARKAAKRIA